ncbi:MAG TPA: hypothetical protein GX700_12115 [Paracoccus sp.]|nr:hypothetical protein [Paracoccus sp. (in: a-proteobacteria)]
MDYGKSGGVRGNARAPRHSEHNARGSTKNPFGANEVKAELIARMKAAAEARKAGKPGPESEG